MDQLDRELKEIQLRRERLALERELARNRMKERVLDGALGTAAMGAGAVLRLLAGIRRFITRWWKVAFLVAALGAAVLGGIEWKGAMEKERRVAEQQRRYAAKEAFVLKECGERCVEDGSIHDNFACRFQNSKHYDPCESAASNRFDKEWNNSPP